MMLIPHFIYYYPFKINTEYVILKTRYNVNDHYYSFRSILLYFTVSNFLL